MNRHVFCANRLHPTLALVLALSFVGVQPRGAEAQLGPTQAELNDARANGSDWLLTGRDYNGQRHVELTQITRANAGDLRPVCAYQAAVPASFYSNPLVYRGVMYVTTRFETLALDARTCRLRWKRDHYPPQRPFVQANRGVAIKDGRIIRGTADGRLVAMNAETGEVLWERKHADDEGGEMFSMPPLIYEDVAVIGVAGSEAGIRGWIGGFRLADGEPVWRFNTVPEPGEPGAETWGSEAAARVGGGGVWTPLTLDPERGHVYVGTANPAPALDGSSRPGANLYTNSLLVLDARTGVLVWHRQLVPHDVHDRGVTAPGPLYAARVDGNLRPLVATAGKDGVLRVIDRESREIVFERPVSEQVNTHLAPSAEGVRVCPGITGGVQWNGPAYSPRRNMLYVPSVEWCTTYHAQGDRNEWLSEHWAGKLTFDPVQDARGRLTAVDASTGEVRWRYESDAPMVAAVTTTATDVLFTGEVSGDFLTIDAGTGDVLYRFNTGGAVAGGVVSYAVDGKQYVAVMSGGMTSFWQRPPGSATMFVFALP